MDFESRPPAVVHVDVDGIADIYRAHAWDCPFGDDSIFETGLRSFLGLFERNGVSATFFVIANSLDVPRKRVILEKVVEHGHEIASHSLTHPNLLRTSREQRYFELLESRLRLETALGVKVRGFRAPGYGMDRECLMLLAHTGYEFDSSVFPTSAFGRLLGLPTEMLMAPHRPVKGLPLVELPLPDHRPSPFPLNPSYSLLFGLRYFRWGLARLARRKIPFVLLFHLIDLAEPLPHDKLKGFQSRLFTISVLNAEQKLARCQSMLDLVRQHFHLITTADLLKEQNLITL